MNAQPDITLTRAARAALEFREVAGITHLMRQYTPHPFHITRPFRHADDPQGMATLYLQSSSGGLYGDDDLGLSVRLGPAAAAYLTTQASTVVHDARGWPGARQNVTLELGAGAWLEYLPDPSILMTGSRLTNRVLAHLDKGARLLMADAQLCHDPEGGERPFDTLDSTVSLTGPDGPIMLDRFDLSGADWMARTGGARCAGMIVAADAPGAGSAMVEALAAQGGIYAGLSDLPDRGVCLLRFLADDGAALTRAMNAAWAAARRALTGAIPHPRRK